MQKPGFFLCVDNFFSDVEFMVGRKLSAYWRLCWGIITPVLMIVILVYSLVTMETETYQDKLFPTSSYVMWVRILIKKHDFL
jgi:solute carrier family 6 amino acid transporter-like protein 5/7/9/14